MFVLRKVCFLKNPRVTIPLNKLMILRIDLTTNMNHQPALVVGVSSNEVCSGEIIAPAANRPKEGRISFHVESTCPGFFVVLKCDDFVSLKMGCGKIQTKIWCISWLEKYDSPLSWLILWEENHLVYEPRNFGLIISDCGRLAVLENHVIPLLTTQLEETNMKSRNFDMDLHLMGDPGWCGHPFGLKEKKYSVNIGQKPRRQKAEQFKFCDP